MTNIEVNEKDGTVTVVHKGCPANPYFPTVHYYTGITPQQVNYITVHNHAGGGYRPERPADRERETECTLAAGDMLLHYKKKEKNRTTAEQTVFKILTVEFVSIIILLKMLMTIAGF